MPSTDWLIGWVDLIWFYLIERWSKQQKKHTKRNKIINFDDEFFCAIEKKIQGFWEKRMIILDWWFLGCQWKKVPVGKMKTKNWKFSLEKMWTKKNNNDLY